MAAELGIGARVFLGWVPQPQVNHYFRFDPRLKRGTIMEGPFRVGDSFQRPQRPGITINSGPSVRWRVDLDSGEVTYPIESIIFPIDDDNNQSTRHERELVGGME